VGKKGGGIQGGKEKGGISTKKRRRRRPHIWIECFYRESQLGVAYHSTREGRPEEIQGRTEDFVRLMVWTEGDRGKEGNLRNRKNSGSGKGKNCLETMV